MKDNPPPYNPQYPPPQHMEGTTVMIGAVPPAGTSATVVIGQSLQFGPHSQSATCPHCRSQILTRVETETTTRTHVMAILLCAFLCLPCVCLPYCMDSCKNKNHYCPSCGAYLGKHES